MSTTNTFTVVGMTCGHCVANAVVAVVTATSAIEAARRRRAAPVTREHPREP
jgi:hypothetical protein